MIPVSIAIEHADPGGVSYPTRNPSLPLWSRSTSNPAFSA
jgi:hypothetical protein